MAVLLIIIKTLVHMVEGTLIKKYNSKHSEGGFIFTAIVSLFSMVFFIITDKNGLCFPPQIWIYAVLAGICYFSASIFTYIALGSGSFALTMLMLSYSLIFTIVYGIAFLKESASVFTYIGILLMLVSIYFVKADGHQKGVKKNITPLWVVAMIISLCGNGFLGILSRMQQIRFNDEYTNEFMIICLAISSVVLFVFGLYKDWGKIIYILRYGGVYAAISGMSNGASNLLGLIVNTMMPISIVSPLSAGIKNLISFLFSVFIFREKLGKRQIFGVIMGTIALILFKL